jgi:hypothetical protein
LVAAHVSLAISGYAAAALRALRNSRRVVDMLLLGDTRIIPIWKRIDT